MFIDLSVTLDNKTPNYPGDPIFRLTQVQGVQTAGYSLHEMQSGTHAGTHIDAPSHMISDGKTADELPFENFIGPAVCIDARDGFEMSLVQNINFDQIKIIIFNTGSHLRYYESDYFTDFPSMSIEMADFLCANDIKLLGLDTCSADTKADFPVHKKLLKQNIPIIENLTNLDLVTGKTFKLYAFPIKLAADAAMVRAVAETTE